MYYNCFPYLSNSTYKLVYKVTTCLRTNSILAVPCLSKYTYTFTVLNLLTAFKPIFFRYPVSVRIFCPHIYTYTIQLLFLSLLSDKGRNFLQPGVCPKCTCTFTVCWLTVVYVRNHFDVPYRNEIFYIHLMTNNACNVTYPQIII